MNKKYTTNSAQKTQEIAAEFAQQILRQKLGKQAVILALSGNLGAGKTTFLQGFAKGLGINEIVNSPTFVIMKSFKLQTSSFKKFYHFDCYRLENSQEILELGFREIIADPKNIVAIEWPEKIASPLLEGAIRVTFEHVGESKRKIKVL